MDPEPGVDFDRPNAARMYDYMLGGGANFAVDRDLVQQLLVVNPDARRVFVAVAHAREMLVGLDTVTVTRADLRDADGVLTAPGVAGLLDFSRPVALLAVAVLHFVPGDITTVLESYRAALAPGSALAISHGSDDQDDPELAERARASCAQYRDSATPATYRSRRELRALFAGLDLVAPGLVDVVDWPEHDADPVGIYGAVGLVPGAGGVPHHLDARG